MYLLYRLLSHSHSVQTVCQNVKTGLLCCKEIAHADSQEFVLEYVYLYTYKFIYIRVYLLLRAERRERRVLFWLNERASERATDVESPCMQFGYK